MTRSIVTLDGNQAAAEVAFKVNEVIAIYTFQYNGHATSAVAVSSSDTITEMTSIGPEAGHITVTIQGQDPMYIHTADTLPAEEQQFISVSNSLFREGSANKIVNVYLFSKSLNYL